MKQQDALLNDVEMLCEYAFSYTGTKKSPLEIQEATYRIIEYIKNSGEAVKTLNEGIEAMKFCLNTDDIIYLISAMKKAVAVLSGDKT